MSDSKDPLGDRMKEQYEDRCRFLLPRRTYTIMRLDGRAFHNYTKGMERPFDFNFMDKMDGLAMDLCGEVAGSVFAYVQSDEISILLQDFESHGTQPWFGGNIQKMVSVAASFAGAWFNDGEFDLGVGRGTFDCRVFTIPDPVEVANYFVWRQRDCVRNSIQMAAQNEFSAKQLHGVSTDQCQEMLFSEKGINWNDFPDGAKRGRLISKRIYVALGVGSEEASLRTHWVDDAAPHFTIDALAPLIPRIPQLPDPLFRIPDISDIDLEDPAIKKLTEQMKKVMGRKDPDGAA